MKQKVLLTIFTLLSTMNIMAKEYKVDSPDKRTQIRIECRDAITFTLIADGREVVSAVEIGLLCDLEHETATKIIDTKRAKVERILQPVVWQKSSHIEDEFNMLAISMANGKTLEWRAYNNGVAWRWRVECEGEFKVLDEISNFTIDPSTYVWYNNESKHYSENQVYYTKMPFEELDQNSLCSLPLMFDNGDLKYAIFESGLTNYAGLWFRKSINSGLHSDMPRYPKEVKAYSVWGEDILSREDFVSKHIGNTDLPWRIIALAREDGEFLTNQLTYQLAEESVGDFSWVKPGKIAWEWMNSYNIIGVDFKAGPNSDTYKYYVDFAATYGLEYILLDGDWYEFEQGILTPNAELDVVELCSYAHSKGVGVFVWAPTVSLMANTDVILSTYKSWGVDGVKIDFFCRDDQPMLYQQTIFAEACSKNKLVAIFHGCPKPAGLQRKYPNILNFEAVYGWEQAKGINSSNRLNPDHNTLLPFIRQLAGPFDYTPGAMDNYNMDCWFTSGMEPSSIGTRCHQLAMYVLYDAPIQMLADSPTKYYREKLSMEFLSVVPVVWRQSIALQSEVGEYASMARQAANGEWYIGVMNNYSDSRLLDLPLSFLERDKQYTIQIWADGINSDRNPRDVLSREFEVESTTTLKVNLQRGGGYVARIVAK